MKKSFYILLLVTIIVIIIFTTYVILLIGSIGGGSSSDPSWLLPAVASLPTLLLAYPIAKLFKKIRNPNDGVDQIKSGNSYGWVISTILIGLLLVALLCFICFLYLFMFAVPRA